MPDNLKPGSEVENIHEPGPGISFTS